MKTRLELTASSLAALLMSTAFVGVASAQEPPPPQVWAPPPGLAPPPQAPDHARFRGGVAAEAGALVVPGVVTVGVAGVQGQIGAQVNNLVGVYAVPTFDIVFGRVGGVNLAFAVMVDFTLDDTFTVGVGPDVGAFAAIGGGSDTVSGAGGALYGGRLHFSWNPVLSREGSSGRRRALAIGADLRVLTGGAAFATVSNSSAGTSTTAAANNFVLAPYLTIGYQSF